MTDEAGRFRVGGYRPGEMAEIVVEAEGYAAASVRGIRLPDDSPVRVTLEAEAVVSGRVVDASGRPVPDAGVTFDPNQARGSRHFDFHQADEEGRFEIRGLPTGAFRLQASSGEHGRSEPVLVEVEAGRHLRNVELKLRTALAVRGIVRRPDGSPALGADIFLRRENTGSSCRPTGGGEFVCSDVEPGRHWVTASEDGVGRGELELDVAADEVGIEVHLEPAVEIRGVVVTAAGEPAPARMMMLRPETWGFPWLAETTTASDGSFRFEGVGDGAYRIVVTGGEGSRWFSHESYTHPETIRVAEGRSVSDLTIVLDEKARLTGRLIGLAPEEAGRAEVTAMATEADAETGIVATARGRVLADGSYVIEGMSAGDWRIDARVGESGQRAEGVVTLVSGEEAVLDLDLRRGGTLTGRVLRNGEPWSGVVVTVFGSGAQGVSDQRGRFQVTGLEPGEQRVSVRSPGRPFSVIRFVSVDEGEEVVLRVETGRIEGTVLSAVGGEPLSGVYLLASTGDGDRRTGDSLGNTAADGRFIAEDVPTGVYEIEVRRAGT